jgi:S-adenosyl methyltransferase
VSDLARDGLGRPGGRAGVTRADGSSPGGCGPRAVVDVSVPNVARIYDYLLGGKDNFAADRLAAMRLVGAVPDIAVALRAAFPSYSVSVIVRPGDRLRFEVVRRGDGNPWCLISADAKEIWRELKGPAHGS